MTNLTTTIFKPRQRVQVTGGSGVSEPATIVRPDRQLAGWYIVRFDDAAMQCVAASSLAVA